MREKDVFFCSTKVTKIRPFLLRFMVGKSKEKRENRGRVSGDFKWNKETKKEEGKFFSDFALGKREK